MDPSKWVPTNLTRHELGVDWIYCESPTFDKYLILKKWNTVFFFKWERVTCHIVILNSVEVPRSNMPWYVNASSNTKSKAIGKGE